MWRERKRISILNDEYCICDLFWQRVWSHSKEMAQWYLFWFLYFFRLHYTLQFLLEMEPTSMKKMFEITKMRCSGGDGKTERQSEQLWKWGLIRRLREEFRREKIKGSFFFFNLNFFCNFFGSSVNRIMCVFSLLCFVFIHFAIPRRYLPAHRRRIEFSFSFSDFCWSTQTICVTFWFALNFICISTHCWRFTFMCWK